MEFPRTAMSPDATLLIVEDDPISALQLRGILEAGGYRVAVAENGDEAFALLERVHPALVISDVLMPGTDGYALCAHIRDDERFRHTLVMLLTAQSEPDDVIRGLVCGADTFVSKPYDPRDLLETVARLLQSEAGRHQEDMPEQSRVHFGGRDYNLRATKAQVLNFFLSAYGSSVRRQLELERAHEALKRSTNDLERRVEERTAALRKEIEGRSRVEEESRERAALLEMAHDAILVCGLDGIVLYWNRSAERIYGWSAAEALGVRLASLLYGEDKKETAEPLNAVRSNGTWAGELGHLTKAGTPVTVQSSWTLLREGHGSAGAVLMINTDITDRKQLEAQFLRTQRLESIGVLAGGIAHDLNNMLAPILLSIGLLRSAIQDEKVATTVGVIEASATRAAEMVKQVLTFARGAEGERVIVQTSHLIREMEKIAGQSFPKSIEITISCPKNLATVLGDATQLHQLLMNLCVNARDAMPGGGTISIGAENTLLDDQYASMNPEARPGPYVLIRVRDTGCGMPPEVIERIFEPFFTTKEVGKGTGLGLSTALAVVRSHGGFLRVASEVGRGTEFSIFLPANAGAELAGLSGREEKAPDGQGEVILVVDDERFIREITRVTLEAHGYKVIAADDGTEALALYAQHRDEVRLVLLDMIMPFLDGPGTIRALKKMNSHLPIIGVSGLTETAKAAESALKGKIPFLPKPYTTDRLLETIKDVLQTETPLMHRIAEDMT